MRYLLEVQQNCNISVTINSDGIKSLPSEHTCHWAELIIHNIIHDEVMSDLTVLSVLSSVRHLGTCWPLEWAFFSVSMFFLHSSASFSYLWRHRCGFTGGHRCDLYIPSWEQICGDKPTALTAEPQPHCPWLQSFDRRSGISVKTQEHI